MSTRTGSQTGWARRAAALVVSVAAAGCIGGIGDEIADEPFSDDGRVFGELEVLPIDEATVYVHTSRSEEGEAALISGELVVTGPCVSIHSTVTDESFPVVWPSDTSIIEASPLTLELPSGQRVTEGDDVSGGGGFYSADSLGLQVTAACLPATEEMAVLNPMGEVEVSAATSVADQCIEESLADLDIDPVASIDYAAWDIEHLLPPPLRTSGPTSDDTALLMGDDVVGEVAVARVAENQYRAVALSYCVPGDVSLDRVPVLETLGGAWELIASTPTLETPPDGGIMLEIDGENPVDSEAYVTGHAICNYYQAIPAAGPDGAFRLTRVVFNEMECVDDEVVYRDMLIAADRWALDDAELLLSGPKGELRYAPVDR